MELINRFRDEGFLVSPKVIDSFSGDVSSFIDFIKLNQPGTSVIDESVVNSFYSFIKTGPQSNVRVVNSFELINEPRNISNWLGYYSNRYDFLSSLISKRVEMKPVVSINRATKLIGRDEFGLIGFVDEIRETASGNFMLGLEDPTGLISLLVSKSSPVFSMIGELVKDEVIGVNVRKSGNWCFVESLIFPDLPVREPKKCDDNSCAVFISDSHVGSNNFLPNPFQRFFDWINGEWGSEAERLLSSRVKYLFFAGDLVDGVGVYPKQEDELLIKDIHKQYEAVADYLKQVPKSIKIIISPGNHDALRLALPQPPLNNEFTTALAKLPNTLFVSNPATVNIHAGNGFGGYDVMVYHGNSFDHFINNVPRLRKLGYERPEAVMEFLLRKRHLSPTHGATLIAPSLSADSLLINNAPDIMVSGHIHHSGVGSYKGTTLLNASCFQGQSDFMKRIGIVPEPGKIPLMELGSRKVHVMDFMDK
ncbi:MAG: DNA-directed DNA polymerase II small subunit [Candidatus Nanoarchaeia archaeon]|jgi:DNA polymerase II small subunit